MESFRWPRWVTIAAVLLLAGIAAVVSYSHMYELALRHGEPEWRASLFPLSVDGMIVGASMTLLSDARHGRKDGLLPWALLIMGSGASLAANVAVADPTMWSRIIHAWPSFALIGAYELLMREFRTAARSVRTASAARDQSLRAEEEEAQGSGASESGEVADLQTVHDPGSGPGEMLALSPFQDRAWQWALEQQRETGRLPSGKEIAAHFGRKERWGRLVKQRGQREGVLAKVG
ncbi:DUF2637 domain-containing protein [Nocardiopsis sp. NRRL B-16309]|uniref:DUF2637 domain-containing protein n=1 Tax=Nocardiopsis sp. NRRL B-16309 TaxID=1519494 RepID=UPI0006ADACAD|nr:DUF2637 domain-containing protein [Nocardiopsis sp. NRRL B-16309]KOX12673.1 hypothetical protein ADL05_20470 [Nocardiopsis sp. NRRL B-16309]